MAEYILVVDTVGGDDYDPGFERYFIARRVEQDPQKRPTHPLLHYNNGYVVPAASWSVKELKEMLRTMLKACDQQPQRLVNDGPKLVPIDG